MIARLIAIATGLAIVIAIAAASVAETVWATSRQTVLHDTVAGNTASQFSGATGKGAGSNPTQLGGKTKYSADSF